MKKAVAVILGMMVPFLFCGSAIAGILSGRIIKEDGGSLAKTRIVVEGKETMTNEFGGYEVELKNGERELNVVIDNVSYISERLSIYSPMTYQNWRMDSKGKRLIKIR